jgi:acyl carrier protein
MSIEEKLGVRIPEGDEARAVFRSVSAIADYVAKVRDA